MPNYVIFNQNMNFVLFLRRITNFKSVEYHELNKGNKAKGFSSKYK